jgi:REP element-mobilizing transposase RayT
MGRSRYRITEPDQPHFVTCTVLEWLPVFTRPETVAILIEALAFKQQQVGLRVYAWVVLENHCHFVLQAPDLSKVLHDFKSYTAKTILAHLQAQRVTPYLERLAYARKAHKHDRSYQFWQEGSHPELIVSPAMMTQKVEYIHGNPVKRGYVDRAEHWRWSSARDYCGQEGLLPVFREW